jgi:S-(hydroxymethyl)glutathione dehydrogenase/alcohol dehydrogenase
MSQYTVCQEIQLAKINPKAPLEKVCLLACGIPTGYGSAVNLAQVREGSAVAVYGLGTIGLSAAMGSKARGASKVIGVDINPTKFELGSKFGCTHFVNPMDHESRSATSVIMELTNNLGVDYAFECTGLPSVAIEAIGATALWGKTVVQGIYPGDVKLDIDPVNFVTGKTVTGGLFGGFKGRKDAPELVELYMDGKLMVDEFITKTVPIQGANEAFDALLSGKALRTIVLLQEEESKP